MIISQRTAEIGATVQSSQIPDLRDLAMSKILLNGSAASRTSTNNILGKSISKKKLEIGSVTQFNLKILLTPAAIFIRSCAVLKTAFQH